ncbi:predicted protein [Sclerotinia sclerotiorum 1980 UF-70]|uniref:Uncharacterized protein n=1 Tax=Sclerotinia sclerotiorum (strain ATCC 18683 / 1980 / Ss-1) TaxID=665079 RepID=A7E4L7_SCLS1|nr:predicted protein [Sclerotinia sclerotiorum 1980 UF-70]EDN90839.1 predicted protein [Sclerotinia sclerotiorum 1980 UF-70]
MPKSLGMLLGIVRSHKSQGAFSLAAPLYRNLNERIRAYFTNSVILSISPRDFTSSTALCF